MEMPRILRHLMVPHWVTKRAFTRAVLDRIEAAIAASEATHRGEIRLAVEGALDLMPLLNGMTPRARALDVFSQLRVWDTAENSGVLVYVQFIDRHIEIVADRGIAARVPQREWDAICRRMEDAFRARRFEQGAVTAIAEISAVLRLHFPAGATTGNELPDRPALL